MPYYEKRIESGPVLEISRYYATEGGRPMGSKNTQESTMTQQELNDVQSWRKLWRMILTNFSRKNGDLCVTLTFRGWMESREAGKKFTKMMREMRAERKKKKLPELKYIIVKETQSGRPHAHIVMNAGLTLEEIAGLWEKVCGEAAGTTWVSMLDDMNNYKDLTSYLTKRHKKRKGSENEENAKEQREKNKRRWTCSRNLKKPTVKKRKCRPVTLHTMPRAPKGYRLLPEMERDADRFGKYYLRWTCVKEEEPGRGWFCHSLTGEGGFATA